MRRGILILTCYICNSTHLIAILRFRKKQKKKIVPCLVLLQNKSCVCVGGILWIQGQSKNGPAMVFFWVEILQIVLTKVCKNFNQIRQFTFRQRRPFIFFMKWEEVAIT